MRSWVWGLLIALAGTVAAAQSPAAARTRAEWAALRDARFPVPPGERAFDLLREMNALVASTDPFLRDNVAYEAAARWIYRAPALTADEQRQILAIWLANLDDGLGRTGTDDVLKRSFSALNLSVLAARDNAAPFLAQHEFDAFLNAALDYLVRERDTRGYDTSKGWIHAIAHTADLLTFLARNQKLAAAAQGRILSAIDQRCAGMRAVFAWGEDERLGQVIASLARRPDLDREAFTRWLAGIPPRHKTVWMHAPAIDPDRYAEVQNVKMVLRAAYVLLSLDTDPTPGSAGAAAILATLKGLR